MTTPRPTRPDPEIRSSTRRPGTIAVKLERIRRRPIIARWMADGNIGHAHYVSYGFTRRSAIRNLSRDHGADIACLGWEIVTPDK